MAFNLTQVNGVPMYRVGRVELSPVVVLELALSKTFGRVHFDAPLITVDIDVVQPKAFWNVPKADVEKYSHINFKVVRIELSPDATGLLGQTARPTADLSNMEVCMIDDRIGRGGEKGLALSSSV